MRAPSLGLVLLAFATSAHATEMCLAPSAMNGFNLTVECGTGAGLSNDWVGYNTEGPPCNVGPTSCYGGSGFGWSISSSSTDPLVNSGPLPDRGSLYLWMYCSTSINGMSAAEFDLVGDFNILSFTPLNGFLSAGTLPQILVAVPGCPRGPVLAGRIGVETSVAVESESWGRIKAVYR